MRIKTLLILSLMVLLAGTLTGGGYAYISQDGDTNMSDLTAGLMPVSEEDKEDALLDDFIAEQEQLHPDGLMEASIATGSKYDGITYNNVSTASKNKQSSTTADNSNRKTTTDEAAANEAGSTNKNTPQSTDSSKKSNSTNSTGSTNNAGSVWAPDGTQKVGVPAVSSGSALNLRKSASLDGEVIGTLYSSDQVLVVSKSGNWYQVVTADGVEGYVSADYLTIQD